MITHRNSLDICPGGVPLIVRLSQYDSSFTLIFDLFSRKGTFTVETGTTARFRELKPDGKAVSIDATISGTTVTLAPTQAYAQQITAIAGECQCELSLFKDDKELNTANFIIIVEKAVIDKDTFVSDSVIRELIEVTDQADEILQGAQLVRDAVDDLPNLIDKTLTLGDHAADAKAVGDALSDLELGTWSTDAKQILMSCFEKVFWKDDDAREYLNSLRIALHLSNRRSELPDTYEQVEYIYGTGTQWATFDILSQSPIAIEAKVLYTNKESNVVTGDKGSVGAASNYRFMGFGTYKHGTPNTIGLRVGSGDWHTSETQYEFNTILNIKTGLYQKDNSLYCYAEVNGSDRIDEVVSPAPSLGYPISIFKRDGDTWIGRNVRFYTLLIYGGGQEKIFDGIPCYRKSDNVSGLYDAVSQTFYPSEGSSNFVIGPIVE